MQRPYYMDPRKAIEFGVADKVRILFIEEFEEFVSSVVSG